jgi:hypothetical protein
VCVHWNTPLLEDCATLPSHSLNLYIFTVLFLWNVVIKMSALPLPSL